MEGFDIPSFIEAYGLPGAAIIYLVIENRMLKNDNRDLHKEVREAIREVFPAMTALGNALDFIKRGGK